MLTITMKVDENRFNITPKTGILVRAQRSTGDWVNADISEITRESLDNWLRSRGGENLWAESIVRLLLGHG